MKFTKYSVFFLQPCLWHMASTVPVPVLNALPSSQPKCPPFPHHMGPITSTPKPQNLPRAAVIKPLARAAEVSANTSSPPSNYITLSGSGLGNTTLTTYCKSNSSTFVDATVAESPPASDCAAIADALISQPGSGFFHYDAADLARRNTTGIKQLRKHGACAFGVAAGAMRSDAVRIGAGDVVSVIRESVRRFAGGGGNATATCGTIAEMKTGNGTAGRLGVAGVFACGDLGTMVNWALYRV
ncbi:hypothetical protein F5Y05DRAFT_52447 [Hypoxylon sp. FL0543]|nr:hypothetical protein F5Y05DRAFT_52447 [Hypoxylon sp. FL0543]